MKPFNFDKFRKDVTKSLGIKEGFYDPKIWIDTGNYALNYRISGDFFRGVPLDGKVTVFAGESGSGKSLIVSGNMIRWCQNNNVLVVLMDTEGAVDRSWIEALGVDPDKTQNILRLPVSSPDDCAKSIGMFMKDYVETYADEPEDQRQPVMFVIDSLGMLSTPTEQDQFERADMKGDMGRKAKQLKGLATQCIRLFNGWPVGLVATNHTYKSQDQFSPDDVIGGGAGFVYASSIVVSMNKLKLKEDDDGNKISDVRGIRAKVKVVKTRFNKPFEEVEIKIPYDSGMDPFSGLLDMFEKSGAVVKEGNKLKYTAKDGAVHKYFRKQFSDELLMQIMREYDETHLGAETNLTEENDEP